MQSKPKILVVIDEPMFIVNLLCELEDRGFAVQPMGISEAEARVHLDYFDAALIDFRHADGAVMQLACRLRALKVHTVALGGRSPFKSLRIEGAEICLTKPIDYDRLADMLSGMVHQPFSAMPHPSAGLSHLMGAAGVEEH